jgi:hypothetical protein
MNRFLNFSLILILVLAMNNIFAQKQVYPLPLDSTVKLSANHFHYHLPTTAVKVDVTVTKVREIKGYYADYAERLLGLTNIISDNRTFYKLKNVSIETTTVPDLDMAFAVEPSKNQIQNNSFAKALLKSQQTENVVFDNTYEVRVTPIPDFFKNYANVSYTETEDNFVETKIINGVVTQVPANRTRLVNKTAEQKVQEAADRITQIRKDRNSLMAGEQEVPYSAEALQLMINQLNQSENDYLDLFRGIALEDEIHYVFYVIPSKEQHNMPLFTINQNLGLSFDTDNAESIYSLRFSGFNTIANACKHLDAKAAQGFRIRQPQAVQIDLTNHGETIHHFGIYQMMQWGDVQILPANLDPELEEVGFVY